MTQHILLVIIHASCFGQQLLPSIVSWVQLMDSQASSLGPKKPRALFRFANFNAHQLSLVKILLSSCSEQGTVFIPRTSPSQDLICSCSETNTRFKQFDWLSCLSALPFCKRPEVAMRWFLVLQTFDRSGQPTSSIICMCLHTVREPTWFTGEPCNSKEVLD